MAKIIKYLEIKETIQKVKIVRSYLKIKIKQIH